MGEEREESGLQGVDLLQAEVFLGLRARTLPHAQQGHHHLDRHLQGRVLALAGWGCGGGVGGRWWW